MRMRTVEIGVGAFMLAGIAALLVLALNVSGLNLSEQGKGYKVYARFENIGGLTPRAKVSMSGVQIGKVTAIELLQQAAPVRFARVGDVLRVSRRTQMGDRAFR